MCYSILDASEMTVENLGLTCSIHMISSNPHNHCPWLVLSPNSVDEELKA